MTTEEEMVWGAVRGRSLGVPIRRQHPVDRFVLDFYCPAARVAFEIDGDVHDLLRDADRDLALAERGIAVVRFSDRQVREELFTVLEEMRRCVEPAANARAARRRLRDANPPPTRARPF